MSGADRGRGPAGAGGRSAGGHGGGAAGAGEALGRLQCPVPDNDPATITMAHGGGGRLTRRLVEEVFAAAFANPALAPLHDGALVDLGDPVAGGRVAMSTDAFVIRPLFFPGGDIGSLAVHGTVNDVAMCGARPVALSAGFILEEGMPIGDLRRIVASMQAAARDAGVPIVTGDTKVVDRGHGDGVYICTTGVGIVPPGIAIAPQRARPGDIILINGPIADHGVAVLSVREGLRFETTITSDAAALHGLVGALLESAGADVHVLRDPTRGGVASALNEIAEGAGAGIRLEEARVPVREEVRGACEILGLDPLYVANEGKVIAFVGRHRAEAALAAMRAHPLGRDAAIIGEVVADHPGRVVMRSRIGGSRVVDMLTGEPLPRIC